MSNTTGLNNVWFYGNWRDSFYYVSDDKVKEYSDLDNVKVGIYTEYDIIALAEDYSQYSLAVMIDGEEEDISLDLLEQAIEEAIMDYSIGLAKWTKIRDQFKSLV